MFYGGVFPTLKGVDGESPLSLLACLCGAAWLGVIDDVRDVGNVSSEESVVGDHAEFVGNYY